MEILQTYQKESKPIGEVYGQVTQLFNAAPDLLEDFKQFLPESAAAQNKAQQMNRHSEEAPTSNIRSEASYINNMPSIQTPKPDPKLPPVGHFAPLQSSSKDNKKRRGGAGSQVTVGGAAGAGQAVSGSRTNNQGGNAAKVCNTSWL